MDHRPPLIELANIEKHYHSRGTRVSALQDVSLRLYEGEILTIVGPSGCGKSTLLNLLAGLEAPDGGTMTVRGGDPARSGLTMGYVTQSDTLFPWRTLLANVEYPLEIRGVGAAHRRARARALLGRVGLAGFENHLPYQLSGGMRQRGNLVRALVYEPDVVLMDEPFGALDAQTRLLLQAQLAQIWAEDRKTIVFITHDLQEAIALGDRVVVMTARPGRIKALREVPLPRPRDLDHIHQRPQFQALQSELWDALREEVLLTDRRSTGQPSGKAVAAA